MCKKCPKMPKMISNRKLIICSYDTEYMQLIGGPIRVNATAVILNFKWTVMSWPNKVNASTVMGNWTCKSKSGVRNM